MALGLKGNLAAGLLGAVVFGIAAWQCLNRIRNLKSKVGTHAAV
jgi:hypothetical protein